MRVWPRPTLRMSSPDILARILDLGRWAPSGDNTQPWRFEIVDGTRAVIHGFDTRDHCVYDLDGRPSQISLGALIETIAIASSDHGLRLQADLRPDSSPAHPVFDLHFVADPSVQRDPLVDVIARRSVQRKPFATTALTATERSELERAVGPGHHVQWVDAWRGRLGMAGMLFRSARLRLVTPEAYRVHRDVIEWDAQFSADRVPDQALGVDKAMLKMMRFAMHSWERVKFFNRFLAGTWMPRIQMDFVPALACASHFLLLARESPQGVEAYVAAGRAMQRFWLTATRLGLMLQPEITPLVFARYAREGRTFSVRPSALAEAGRVGDDLRRLLGAQAVSHGVFMGRIGHAPQPTARSVRKELSELRHGAAASASQRERA